LTQCVFGPELDAVPCVRAWLDGLDDATRASLRDDPTPMFKEIPSATVIATAVVDEDEDEDDVPAWRYMQGEDDERRAIKGRARGILTKRQYACFCLWLDGLPKAQIGKALGISRSTVRSMLDGEGSTDNARRAGPGAIEIVYEHAPEFRKVVSDVAAKNNKERAARNDERLRYWYQPALKEPALIPALSLLLIIDSLVDGKDECPVADLLPYWPRSQITPCLQALRGFGYAGSDGLKIKVHRRPQPPGQPR
jgi:DNA-binding CsgD family transcriptional regulator